ncbi:MAG: ABC transporter ATP-binding protein [Deltaproteobacteria bacterium CG_4_9_14_3_um_filter_44_9]|nr:MAG: ABC transporter ATP-binding protein [Deltaproteobacteria bacterium CG06_land_8_20_14_3_00_44_19]PIX26223.1 MAG: ABC transporter ATP-binding protein [Deltaproteobacteria bacterium CG_4_8_14_3_um_filter_43_13]PIZ20603.1 MAG: ABC transporter ATP-binding protein [Deltaproteobacteria bacterium CG_4_10_14_0_8_um_filter_43_12]PJB40268.1 MAG: ABC transporter ATP-binding protein [Deltaproteobacteria bacterium CG_4_9_14_3_um_filter_44_9]HCX90034.1 ABC transporter ATP-binding protein [Deltaproteob
MNREVVVKIDNLNFSYNGEEILSRVTMRVFSGEIFVIIGPSGSGKSTLLKLCAGLFHPRDGDVDIKGINVHKAPKDRIRKLRGKMGFVFQDAALISNTCIFDNVALPLRYHTDLSEPEIEKMVSEKLSLLQIDRSCYYLLPAQLSLGLKRSVGVARALVIKPDIVFFDEITASFDSQTIKKISMIIKDLKNLKVTSIIVTGDASLAYSIADRIAIIKNGKIIQTGTPDEIRNSQDPDVILMTSMNK